MSTPNDTNEERAEETKQVRVTHEETFSSIERQWLCLTTQAGSDCCCSSRIRNRRHSVCFPLVAPRERSDRLKHLLPPATPEQ